MNQGWCRRTRDREQRLSPRALAPGTALRAVRDPDWLGQVPGWSGPAAVPQEPFANDVKPKLDEALLGARLNQPRG